MENSPSAPDETAGAPLPARIVSGGQTGADRAALEFARARGIPHGGWCPRGRLAEDGSIPSRFRLRETPDDAYPQRTEWNVRDSDATAVFTLAAEPRGGSRKTIGFARTHGKPCLHLSLEATPAPARALRSFLEEHSVRVLNVAGSRESSEPGIGKWVREVLDAALAGPPRGGFRR